MKAPCGDVPAPLYGGPCTLDAGHKGDCANGTGWRWRKLSPKTRSYALLHPVSPAPRENIAQTALGKPRCPSRYWHFRCPSDVGHTGLHGTAQTTFWTNDHASRAAELATVVGACAGFACPTSRLCGAIRKCGVRLNQEIEGELENAPQLADAMAALADPGDRRTLANDIARDLAGPPNVYHWKTGDVDGTEGGAVHTACGRVVGYQRAVRYGAESDCDECERAWVQKELADSLRAVRARAGDAPVVALASVRGEPVAIRDTSHCGRGPRAADPTADDVAKAAAALSGASPETDVGPGAGAAGRATGGDAVLSRVTVADAAGIAGDVMSGVCRVVAPTARVDRIRLTLRIAGVCDCPLCVTFAVAHEPDVLPLLAPAIAGRRAFGHGAAGNGNDGPQETHESKHRSPHDGSLTQKPDRGRK